MNSVIYVQALFHRAEKNKGSINKILKERGWEEHSLSGSSVVWKGCSKKMNCRAVSDLELRAKSDFISCAIIHGVNITILCDVKSKSESKSENRS